jgi:hypothetical protein
VTANAPIDDATADVMLEALRGWLAGGSLVIVDALDTELVSIPLAPGVGTTGAGVLTLTTPIDDEATASGDAVAAYYRTLEQSRRVGPIDVGDQTSGAPIQLAQDGTSIPAGAQVTVLAATLRFEDLSP